MAKPIQALSTPYHCAFFFTKSSLVLDTAVAWRRIGCQDFGVCLTSRLSGGDDSPICSVFKATYSLTGEIVSFFVRDGFPEHGAVWDEDHIDSAGRRLDMDRRDVDALSGLLASFVSDWLVAFGSDSVEALFDMAGVSLVSHGSPWERILNAGVPVDLHPLKKAEVLARADVGPDGGYFALAGSGGHSGDNVSLNALLLDKLQQFLELL